MARDSGDTTTLYVVVTITEKVSGRVMDAQSVAVPAIAANSSSAVSLSLSIGPAHTWSPDQPALLRAVYAPLPADEQAPDPRCARYSWCSRAWGSKGP